MYWADIAIHAMLNALDESTLIDFASLHTAYSTSGANEVTGGSPAYARKGVTWAAATARAKALTTTLPTFDVPAGTSVAWIGLQDAVTAGNFCGMVPNGGGALKPFAVMDDTNDNLYSEAHGFSNTNTVVVWGPNLPAPLAVGTIYYVIGSAADLLQLSATSGGASIAISDEGEGFIQAITVEVFGAQGTLAVSSLSVDLGAVA